MINIKMLITVLCAVFILFSAAPGWTITTIQTVTFFDPVDSILGWEKLANSGDDSEKGFAARVLGITVPVLEANYVYIHGDALPEPNPTSGTFDFPGYSLAYAIVKVDGKNDFSYLFMDDNSTGSLLNGDDKLTTPAAGSFPFNMSSYGISHVSGVLMTSTNVPEPLTLLLLGLGLVGVAGVRRFKM